MSGNGFQKEPARTTGLTAAATILAILLIVPFVVFVACAQADTEFTRADRFSIPGVGGVSTIGFNASGSYAQATLENGAWRFVGLSFRNFTQQRRLDLTVSAQDSNLTITSYRAANASDANMGNVRIRYVVEGHGLQSFNFGPLPAGGYWDVIFHGVYKQENDGWSLSPDGTLTVTGAASGIDVSIVYWIFPASYVEALSQPVYIQHSVAIATGAAVLVIVALCLAIWRRNLKASRQNQPLEIGQDIKETAETVQGLEKT